MPFSTGVETATTAPMGARPFPCPLSNTAVPAGTAPVPPVQPVSVVPVLPVYVTTCGPAASRTITLPDESIPVVDATFSVATGSVCEPVEVVDACAGSICNCNASTSAVDENGRLFRSVTTSDTVPGPNANGVTAANPIPGYASAHRR